MCESVALTIYQGSVNDRHLRRRRSIPFSVSRTRGTKALTLAFKTDGSLAPEFVCDCGVCGTLVSSFVRLLRQETPKSKAWEER